MLKQIKLLTKLELCNIYNLNVLRFSKNSRRKKKDLSVMMLWLFLIVMLIFYVSNLRLRMLLDQALRRARLRSAASAGESVRK